VSDTVTISRDAASRARSALEKAEIEYCRNQALDGRPGIRGIQPPNGSPWTTARLEICRALGEDSSFCLGADADPSTERVLRAVDLARALLWFWARDNEHHLDAGVVPPGASTSMTAAIAELARVPAATARGALVTAGHAMGLRLSSMTDWEAWAGLTEQQEVAP
jgi:hypothetical protein